MEIEDLEKEMERLSRQPDNPTKNRLLAKAKVQIMADKRRLEAFNVESEGVAGASNKARLITTMLYPGAEITIGKVSTRVTHQHGMCTVSLVRGEILIV